MKKAVAILLNIVFSASMLFSAFVVADYFVRYDYYRTVLCENQDEPELECNGKCHLALNQEEDQKQDAPLPKIEEFQVEALHGEAEIEIDIPIAIPQRSSVIYDQDVVQSTLVNRLLRPPQFIVLA